jgi:NADPH:quinone reductase-like Zn-dependent oxidoreductase
MKALQVNSAKLGPVLIPAELRKPEPGVGEILVQVHAAGVTPTELLWYPTTHTNQAARTPGRRPVRRRVPFSTVNQCAMLRDRALSARR